MVFVILTFLAAFLIEGLGTAVSVIGLSTLFGANPIIISLAIALDLGKLVVVSLLYKHWGSLGKVMKSYALVAAFVTMVITSAGAAGYLTGEFQKAIMGTQETSLKVDVLKQQQAKYEERKKQIDQQIAALPEKTTVNQRLRMMNAFKAEQTDLQNKINEIDKQLPQLQIQQIGVNAKAGPILYIAKAFDTSVEAAVKYVVLMIIFVFDPLAVFLIIAGNFLLENQRKPKKHDTSELKDLLHKATKQLAPPTTDAVTKSYVADQMGTHPEIDLDHYVNHDEAMRMMPQELRKPRGWTDYGIETQVDIQPPIFEELQPSPEGVAATEQAHIAKATEWLEGLKAQEVVEVPAEEPIVEPEPVEPVAPAVAEPMPEAVPTREQITLDDLRPVHRSLLNDVRGDASVTFDQSPRTSAQAQLYRSQS